MAALAVANWLPRKGILELLDAVAGLPDEVVTLHLVGDTAAAGSYARRVRRRLEQSDLRDRVVVHGIVSPSVVERMYRTVDVFVLPSFEEPYGTVWGEAMAAGLPVIGWQAGNLPFLADHGTEGMLARVGDVPGLGAAIDRLARDPDLRAAMGRAAGVRAAARPTWDETATHSSRSSNRFGFATRDVTRELVKVEVDCAATRARQAKDGAHHDGSLTGRSSDAHALPRIRRRSRASRRAPTAPRAAHGRASRRAPPTVSTVSTFHPANAARRPGRWSRAPPGSQPRRGRAVDVDQHAFSSRLLAPSDDLRSVVVAVLVAAARSSASRT